MNVKNVEKEATSASLTIEVTKEDLEPAINKVFLKARKDIQMPGFRKGKAPRAVIEAAYGKHVFYDDALEEIFPEIYKNCVLAQEDLKPVGRPVVKKLDILDNEGVEMVIATDLYPEVTLGDYKGIEAEKDEVVVTDEEVEEEVNHMAQNVARIQSVERPAENGDTAVIDFEGFKDGVAFNGGKGEKYELKLGSNSFIPGFEEQVVGMTAGEEKDINVTFPEDYHSKDLAGAAVVFKVKVHEVKETVLPEINDDFAKDVSEFDTLEELRADIRKKHEEGRQASADRAFRDAVLEKAAENMTAEIPESMIEEEVDRQLERMDYELRSQGASLDAYVQMLGGDMAAIRNSLRPGAEKAVRINVMLDAVVTAENIEATDEECEEEYAKLAEGYHLDVEKVKEIIDIETHRGDIQVRKAADLIVDSAVAVAPAKEEE